MVVKRLLALLLNRNSEQLIEKISDSYLMRRAAQMVVSVFYRTKAIAQEQKLDEIVDKQRLKMFIEKFQKNIEEEVLKAKQELEAKKK
jgi:mediator of RNA polymerase II transcription subunit 9